MTIPTIETARLILRAPRPADFPGYAAFYASDRSVYEDGPLSRIASWKEFAAAAAGWPLRGYGSLSIEERASRRYAGEIGIYHLATYPEPEIGWMVVREAEGRGIAREAAAALRAWTYARFGWTTLVSYIDPANARSIRLAERLGARPDPEAPLPDDEACLVYRHPGPEAPQ